MIVNIGRQLANLAYRAAIKEIAELQQAQATRAAVEALHGARAMQVEAFRRHIHRHDLMDKAPQRFVDEGTHIARRLDELYAVVAHLEDVFARAYAMSDQEFNEAMAAMWRQRQAEAKRP